MKKERKLERKKRGKKGKHSRTFQWTRRKGYDNSCILPDEGRSEKPCV